MDQNKERFLTLCNAVERDGVKDLLDWLNQTDFYDAPASSKFHGSYPGGLLKHSLNVYDELKRLLTIYPEIRVSDESVIISALFHDICKVNFYTKEKRNRKNELSGQWESYNVYTIHEKFCFGGHGSKSVYLIQHFIELKPEEAIAVNCHMGAFAENPRDISRAYEQCPFAWLLHVADEAATYLLEGQDL